MTIELNIPETAAEWNEIILGELVAELGESHLVTRVAKRIAAKGFELLEVQKRKGVREGFNWGRSSHGERRVTIREINFAHPENPAKTFAVIAVSQIINYTKSNPYDRAPENNGVEQSTIQAMDDAKAALGWAA
jgi:hypothetical protein